MNYMNLRGMKILSVYVKVISYFVDHKRFDFVSPFDELVSATNAA